MKRILFILFTFSLTCFSQEKWSLERCISHAQTHNLNSKNAHLSEKIGDENIKVARLGYLPSAGIGVSNQTQITRENDPKTLQYLRTTTNNSTNLGLNASVEIFGGLRKYYAVKKAISDFAISQADAQTLRNNIALSVIQAYVTILLNKELIASAQKQVEVSEINIEKAEQLHKAGNFTEEKLQNLLAQKDQELYALVSAEGTLQTAKIEMCNLLNLTNYDTFDVEDIDIELFSENVNTQKYTLESSSKDKITYLEEVVSRMPEIKSATAKITSSEFAEKLTKSALYPTLSLSASYGTSFNSSSKIPMLDGNGNYIFLPGNTVAQTDYSIGDQLRNNQMGYVGLSLNIPITSYFQVRKNVKMSKYRIEQLKNDLENNRKDLTEKLLKLTIELGVAKNKYETSESVVKHTETILFHINQKFSNGIVAISDYNIAKENLLIAQARMSAAKFEYLLKKKLLEYYIEQ